MPMRVGIDLVAVASVAEALERHGDRYLARVFTAGEAQACRTAGNPDPVRLAAVLAAKEAAMKVLRPARGTPLPWTDIEVRLARDDASTLALSGSAARLAAGLDLDDLSVSLTWERGHAAAVVLAAFRVPAPIMTR